jgi:hypothetical protein
MLLMHSFILMELCKLGSYTLDAANAAASSLSIGFVQIGEATHLRKLHMNAA